MSSLSDISTAFMLWTGEVARTVEQLLERLRSRARLQLVQDAEGFMLSLVQQSGGGGWARLWGERHSTHEGAAPLLPHHLRGLGEAAGEAADPLPPEWAEAFRGSRAEIVLQPSGFLFRPLELPKRAGEFLEGIVRSQIDRLTPWNATEAVYHWTGPSDAPNERIALTVVATTRAVVMPLVQAVTSLGANSVAVSTLAPDAAAARVTVFEKSAQTAIELKRVRTALLGLFAATGLAATLSLVASGFLDDYYDQQTLQIQHRIATRRAAIRAGQDGESGFALLAKRKQSTSASVLVLEELSSILPDNTYATELHIDGDKLQIVGITQDAPSLIEILERSPHFTHATFFAPTTHAATDPGDRFHIEAHIRPHFGIGT
jgi:general secretion pathway protein L